MAFNGRTVLSQPDDGPVARLFYNLIFILVHTFVYLVIMHILIKNKH